MHVNTSTYLAIECCTGVCNIVSKQFEICLPSMFNAILYHNVKAIFNASTAEQHLMDLCECMLRHAIVPFMCIQLQTSQTRHFSSTSIFTLESGNYKFSSNCKCVVDLGNACSVVLL